MSAPAHDRERVAVFTGQLSKDPRVSGRPLFSLRAVGEGAFPIPRRWGTTWSSADTRKCRAGRRKNRVSHSRKRGIGRAPVASDLQDDLIRGEEWLEVSMGAVALVHPR